jgi:hypothetical protein
MDDDGNVDFLEKKNGNVESDSETGRCDGEVWIRI